MGIHASFCPNLSTRVEADEWMDEQSVGGRQLARALRNLRRVNHLLGGYTASLRMLDPVFRRRDRVRILDLGCGSGDHLVHLARRGDALDCTTDLVGLDTNPAIVGHARAHLDRKLPGSLRSQVHVEIGDALSPPYSADTFDVAHAALFLHHFHGLDAVQLLRTMDRVSRLGLVVNDLHRHRLAYVGFWLLSRALGLSPIVQHDGLISVRRGFRGRELSALAKAAQLPPPQIRWHWAFRWSLSTIANWE